MSQSGRRAIFADLVYSEEGQLAGVVDVGGVPHYAVPDGDFMRHVEAEHIDRQILSMVQERIKGMRDLIAEGVIHMTGQEDLFTQAAVDYAIDNIERILEAGSAELDQLRTALWMTKFRATVNVHGDVVGLETPGWEGTGEEE